MTDLAAASFVMTAADGSGALPASNGLVRQRRRRVESSQLLWIRCRGKVTVCGSGGGDLLFHDFKSIFFYYDIARTYRLLRYLMHSGTILAGVFRNLAAISLGANRLSGIIPPSIFNLSSLTVLDMSYCNHLTGSIPEDIGITLPNLQYLGLDNNQFTGSIPISISNLSDLGLFQVSHNNLIGKVPTMEGLHKIQFINILDNQLGSEGVDDDLSFICSSINATNLKVLSVDRNKFGGMHPKCVGNLSTNLELFSVADNDISGSIPTGIENLINLNWLNMWSNKFNGNILTNIGKLIKLNKLKLDDNNFYGNIPSPIGNFECFKPVDFEKQ
ncbi:probable LRR receptor-like serine/threonine-protein kinase At3g47570 [Cornus florida]|uniref:probable LRR receptor-like serine/threonine-protein kinase At3g47570 n=1 Tax=Cornus florida TaxID=4283 RepID=UPI00289777D1|nr:probable LRR receptor-like serine/threonine-protein kinase At3g47570 [Cornus florida]